MDDMARVSNVFDAEAASPDIRAALEILSTNGGSRLISSRCLAQKVLCCWRRWKYRIRIVGRRH